MGTVRHPPSPGRPLPRFISLSLSYLARHLCCQAHIHATIFGIPPTHAHVYMYVSQLSLGASPPHQASALPPSPSPGWCTPLSPSPSSVPCPLPLHHPASPAVSPSPSPACCLSFIQPRLLPLPHRSLSLIQPRPLPLPHPASPAASPLLNLACCFSLTQPLSLPVPHPASPAAPSLPPGPTHCLYRTQYKLVPCDSGISLEK